MLDTIGEFKINSITPENLRETAKLCDKAKLHFVYCILVYITIEKTKKMIENNIPLDVIKSSTGLSDEELAALS